jgi:hypothetical protein
LELIPKYFEPEALAAVSGDREIVSELLQLPFDFIFLTGSVSAGKAVMKAAAEHLAPVVSHSTAKRGLTLWCPRKYCSLDRRETHTRLLPDRCNCPLDRER